MTPPLGSVLLVNLRYGPNRLLPGYVDSLRKQKYEGRSLTSPDGYSAMILSGDALVSGVLPGSS